MRPITAADLMNPEVLAVGEDLTVEELARFLIDNEISGAPVKSADGELVGVVSLHDVVAAVVDDGEDNGEDDADAGDDTDDQPATALDGDEALAAEAGAEVGEDTPGGGEGADDDPLDSWGDDLLVEDVMTPGVVSVSEDALVPEIASLMLKEHLHRLLVMEDGEPRGIISTSDLLGLLVDEG